ncbi:hypothetical protein KUTeg_003575 [Tegillarca granosa]|uniref:NUDE domain-containing protein n=1 Tax=Tegillarca granosa TaxID=220873 RepID=A0ABQ9FMG9_TEGGR|nr:hypothetical protein KUTeg_003575 [Tegillarca granosa]
MDSKKFATPQEEIIYWREAAERFKRESSASEKLELLQCSSHKSITELQDELAQVSAFKDELQRYIRELEQTNDDLERAKRATVVSLEDFEAIERNAFLESELDEKETLVETVQRLKDEARDLRHEIDVTKKVEDKSPLANSVGIHTPSPKESDTSIDKPKVDSNKLTDSGYVGTSDSYRTPPTKGIPSSVTGTGSPLTPSARIHALNIVGDLLRKVGALESKLNSCRNFVKDPPRSGKPGGNSPVNSPRPKRLNRGASVPPQQGVKIPV